MNKGFNYLRHSGVQQNIFSACYIIGIYKRTQVQETKIMMNPRHWAVLAAIYILRVTGDENFSAPKLMDFMNSPEWLDLNLSSSSLYRIIEEFVLEGLLTKDKHKFVLTKKGMELLNYVDYSKNYVLKRVHEHKL